MQDEPEVPRVWLPFDDAPGLAMARAFGDFCLKEYGVISIPEFSHRVLTDKDQFIVLASDGVRVFNPILFVYLSLRFSFLFVKLHLFLSVNFFLLVIWGLLVFLEGLVMLWGSEGRKFNKQPQF